MNEQVSEHIIWTVDESSCLTEQAWERLIKYFRRTQARPPEERE